MKDEIIRMAKEAGKFEGEADAWNTPQLVEYLERFAALVAAAEREACEKEALWHSTSQNDAANSIAKSIRARGNA